ncbi:MAG: hypothetical protein HY545_02400 [Candidatus Doudnabacteria bacterium]|nr:hypothetical protein [Candidatus Doudnabacteria bacterium]
MRIFATICLVAVATVGLLGFSLYIDFQKAQAFFGIDAAIQIAFEFVKALAKALMQKIIAKFSVDILTKLESVHTIKNILNYSDALGFDVYIGAQLNSLLNPNKSNKDIKNEPKDTNLASIVTGSNQLPLNSSPLFSDPKKVEALAGLNIPAKVTSSSFNVNPREIKKGRTAELRWDVAGDNIFVQLQGKEFGANNLISIPNSGTKTVSPQQSTAYYLNISSRSNALVIKQLKVELKVENTASDGFVSGITPGSGQINVGAGGLNPEQETLLVRGGLAMLTSAVSCGGVNTQALNNLALYQATKARGFLMSELDPRSTADYYRRMARLGNPYASPQFQYLSMQDLAYSVEAQGRAASNLELISTGNKVPRSASNTITRAATTINSSLDKTLDSLFKSKSEQGDVAFSGVATKVIAGFVSDLIVNTIFKQKNARLLTEKNSCGVPKDSTETTAPNYQSPTPTTPPDDIIIAGCQENIVACDDPNINNPFIRVNGKTTEIVNSGDSVTVNWSVGSLTGAVAISVDPPPDLEPAVGAEEKIGTRTFKPTRDTQLSLLVDGETIAVAVVNISTITGGGGPGNEVSCSPASQTVNVNQTASFTASGGDGTYSWTANGSGNPEGTGATFATYYSSAGQKTVTVTSAAKSASCSVIVTNPGGSPPGSQATFTASPNPIPSSGAAFTLSWNAPSVSAGRSDLTVTISGLNAGGAGSNSFVASGFGAIGSRTVNPGPTTAATYTGGLSGPGVNVQFPAVTVTVAGSGLPPPPADQCTATKSGPSVSINWTIQSAAERASVWAVKSGTSGKVFENSITAPGSGGLQWVPPGDGVYTFGISLTTGTSTKSVGCGTLSFDSISTSAQTLFLSPLVKPRE